MQISKKYMHINPNFLCTFQTGRLLSSLSASDVLVMSFRTILNGMSYLLWIAAFARIIAICNNLTSCLCAVFLVLLLHVLNTVTCGDMELL